MKSIVQLWKRTESHWKSDVLLRFVLPGIGSALRSEGRELFVIA